MSKDCLMPQLYSIHLSKFLYCRDNKNSRFSSKQNLWIPLLHYLQQSFNFLTKLLSKRTQMLRETLSKGNLFHFSFMEAFKSQAPLGTCWLYWNHSLVSLPRHGTQFSRLTKYVSLLTGQFGAKRCLDICVQPLCYEKWTIFHKWSSRKNVSFKVTENVDKWTRYFHAKWRLLCFRYLLNSFAMHRKKHVPYMSLSLSQ